MDPFTSLVLILSSLQMATNTRRGNNLVVYAYMNLYRSTLEKTKKHPGFEIRFRLDSPGPFE